MISIALVVAAITTGIAFGIPTPALNAALSYIDTLRQPKLPANLIQGLRDYFGAHTYERTDREGIFHTVWQDEPERIEVLEP